MLRWSSCEVPCWVSNRRARSAAWATSSAAAVSSARSAAGHGYGDQRPNVSAPRSDGVRNGSAASARTFSSCRSAAESRSGAPSLDVPAAAGGRRGRERRGGVGRQPPPHRGQPLVRLVEQLAADPPDHPPRGAVVDAERRLVDVGGVERVAEGDPRHVVEGERRGERRGQLAQPAQPVGDLCRLGRDDEDAGDPPARVADRRHAALRAAPARAAASPTVSGNGAGLPVSISRRRAGAASGHASGKTSAAGRPSAAGCRAPSRSAYASL